MPEGFLVLPAPLPPEPVGLSSSCAASIRSSVVRPDPPSRASTGLPPPSRLPTSVEGSVGVTCSSAFFAPFRALDIALCTLPPRFGNSSSIFEQMESHSDWTMFPPASSAVTSPAESPFSSVSVVLSATSPSLAATCVATALSLSTFPAAVCVAVFMAAAVCPIASAAFPAAVAVLSAASAFPSMARAASSVR